MENEEEQKVKRDGKTGVLVTRIKKNKKRKSKKLRQVQMFLSLQCRFTVRPSISLFPPLVTLIDTPQARRGINETHLHGNILTPGRGEDRQTPFEGKQTRDRFIAVTRRKSLGNSTDISFQPFCSSRRIERCTLYLRFAAEWKSNLSRENIEKNNGEYFFFNTIVNEDHFIFEE